MDASLRVFYNGSELVYEREWGSSETGNATVFRASVSVNETGRKGDYVVVVEACDILGECANASASFSVRDVFTVPGDFASISEALASSSVADGVTLAVSGVVNESGVVVVDKRVRIVGVSSGARVSFNGSGYGFNLTAGGVVVEDLSVDGAAVGFLLCSNGNIVSGVSVEASRFLELCGTSYMNNSVSGSTLNGTRVFYSYSSVANLTGDYADAYLYAGSYIVEDASIGYLEAAGSNVTVRSSRLGWLRDLGGSSIELYDSSLGSYNGTASSRLTAYRGLTVTVLFGGRPVEGARVSVKGALLAEPLNSTTGPDGTASFTVPVARGAESISERNATVRVTASYMGFEKETILDLEQANTTTLELPTPSLNATLTDLLGNPVSAIEPGQLLSVNATYELGGFHGSASAKIFSASFSALARASAAIRASSSPLAIIWRRFSNMPKIAG